MRLSILPTALLLLFATAALAQRSTSSASDYAPYKLLNVPTSPAFILLDAEPITVEEPTSPTDFFASLRNATTGFTAFPNTYAVNFAPGWVFGGKKFNYDNFSSGRHVGQNIGQTSIISLGVLTQTPDDIEERTRASLGFKFSLWPGKADTVFGEMHQKKQFLLSKIDELRQEFDDASELLLQQDANYVTLDKLIKEEATKDEPDIELLQNLMASRDRVENAFRDKVIADYQDQLAELRDTISSLTFRRTGFFFDMAGGMAWQFPNNNVSAGGLDRFSFWTTFGCLTKGDVHFIGTARLMNFQDQLFIDPDSGLPEAGDNLYMDAGGRLVYRRDRFDLSAEGVVRSALNNDAIGSTSRVAFSVGYQVGTNQVFNFTFGKNFDGTVDKGGSLIAVLNFLLGFGNKRPY
ncbi:MAG: hypothetical protein H6565_14200 [Lewinellaceae bacterium]|nr:hypothetical protein [Lewinellaceae bacterium]